METDISLLAAALGTTEASFQWVSEDRRPGRDGHCSHESSADGKVVELYTSTCRRNLKLYHSVISLYFNLLLIITVEIVQITKFLTTYLHLPFCCFNFRCIKTQNNGKPDLIYFRKRLEFLGHTQMVRHRIDNNAADRAHRRWWQTLRHWINIFCILPRTKRTWSKAAHVHVMQEYGGVEV